MLYNFLGMEYGSQVHYLSQNLSNCVIEMLIISVTLCVIYFGYNYNKKLGIVAYEYYIIMLFCACSFCFFISANNLILIYVLIELQSICTYVLVSINRNSKSSVEAGIKYYILSAFSSVFLLFGFSLLYGICGTLSVPDISIFLTEYHSVENDYFSYTVVLSMIFINVGFLFKLYAAPLHF